MFMPITFPLTIGGETVGLLIGFRAEAQGVVAVGMLTTAALAYAAVTGLSIYIAGCVEPRLSDRAGSCSTGWPGSCSLRSPSLCWPAALPGW